jgi:hypothetical protein
VILVLNYILDFDPLAFDDPVVINASVFFKSIIFFYDRLCMRILIGDYFFIMNLEIISSLF